MQKKNQSFNRLWVIQVYEQSAIDIGLAVFYTQNKYRANLFQGWS